jgi:hypothetical protein
VIYGIILKIRMRKKVKLKNLPLALEKLYAAGELMRMVIIEDRLAMTMEFMKLVQIGDIAGSYADTFRTTVEGFSRTLLYESRLKVSGNPSLVGRRGPESDSITAYPYGIRDHTIRTIAPLAIPMRSDSFLLFFMSLDSAF